MHIQRPSLSLLGGTMLLVSAIAAWFFIDGESMDDSKDLNGEIQQNKRTRPTMETSSPPRGSARSKQLDRIEKLISERFPEERDIEFNNGPSDLAQSYKAKGLVDFFGQMRNALRGNEDSLAEIFTIYRAEPESYGIFINILIENLGDDFFFEQIRKQPESTQSMVLGQIWQVIYRRPLDYQSDGSIPVADSGRYYPKTGELFLKLLEKKLESDHWQRQRRLKMEQDSPLK